MLNTQSLIDILGIVMSRLKPGLMIQKFNRKYNGFFSTLKTQHLDILYNYYMPKKLIVYQIVN